jgi:glycosyltransferase involved in cell wall biosynthesis
MHILMLVQLVDEREWLRGFTVKWIRALAARVEHVTVITLELGEASLPANVTVYSMGKEKGKNRLRELWRFHRAMLAVIRDVDLIFAHMTPRYILVAAPYAWWFRRPQVLWYTHGHVSLELRLAHAIARRCVTATPESFRLPSRKLDVVGHGIDMSQFALSEAPPPERMVLAVGRLMPVKNHDLLVEAAARLLARPGFEDVQVLIAGGETPQFPGYADTLRAVIAEQGLSGHVRLLGAVPYDEIAALYRRAAATVSLSETGSLDKAVLESLASGAPVLAYGEVYLPLLGDDTGLLRLPSLDPGVVADRLALVLALPEEERLALGRRLAARVRAEHDIEALFDRLAAIFGEVAGGGEPWS